MSRQEGEGTLFTLFSNGHVVYNHKLTREASATGPNLVLLVALVVIRRSASLSLEKGTTTVPSNNHTRFANFEQRISVSKRGCNKHGSLARERMMMRVTRRIGNALGQPRERRHLDSDALKRQSEPTTFISALLALPISFQM